ncbi:YafY family protein [soil metagenome]
MARSDRLFRLLHVLRTEPAPVTAERLAAATGVSLRTLYRDIGALRAGGALIDGAAGFGYRLTEDPALPPQSFTRLEIEALVLGLAEVRAAGDPALADAAAAAQGKLVASLPGRLQAQAMHAVLMVHRARPRAAPAVDPGLLRRASWDEEALDIAYVSGAGERTERRVLPLATVFVDHALVLLAWCCLRRDFRQFRLDRIACAAATGDHFRPRRVPLLRRYVRRLSGVEP